MHDDRKVLAGDWINGFVLATPAQAMAQSSLHPPNRLGVRVLSEKEMGRIVGSLHMIAVSDQSGSAFSWEESVGR